MTLGRAVSSALGVLGLCALASCSGTLDSLGGSSAGESGVGGSSVGGAGGASASGGKADSSAGEDGGSDAGASGAGDSVPVPVRLTGPATYPNLFRDFLGKTEPEISTKLNTAYKQLFKGTSDTTIYIDAGADGAYIHDVLHDDVRTEGLGVGMIVAVELANYDGDKTHQDEFDALWTYAKNKLQVTTGAASGYFNSTCDDTTACLDPYGMEQFVTALLFAHDLWGSSAAKPYGTEALQLMSQLRNKEAENGGVVDDITSVFDASTALPFEQPTASYTFYTRNSLQMPAEFELWAQASGDPFWKRAADAARVGLVASADAKTGLWPLHNQFDGTPVAGADFRSASYRTLFNVALDSAWGFGSAAQNTAQTEVADRLLGFFHGIGVAKYGAIYNLDGTATDATREAGLVAANGALAQAATPGAAKAGETRFDFVSAAWNETVPIGQTRYFDGILYLMSMLVLSGQYQVL